MLILTQSPPLTLRMIKEQSPVLAPSLIQVMEEFNAQDAAEKNHSEKTVYKYRNFTENLTRFLKQNNQQDLSITEVKISLLKSFTTWLKEDLKSCSRTHLSKHIHRINKAISHAVIMDYIPHHPTLAYKIKRDRNKAVVNLHDEQFMTWTDRVWHLEIYTHAQDNYTMQMSAGLSYMDLFNYITYTDRQGRLWIECTRGKTGKMYYVPLWHPEFKKALDIHQKYQGKLPHIENHFYNRLIREMAAQLGIGKYLTTHTGRKTFATLKDESGWNTPAIATVMGNSRKVCEEHYIGSSKKPLENELLKRGA